jgi:hypothetical protein
MVLTKGYAAHGAHEPFFEPLMASELNPRLTLSFHATQPGTFQIIRPELDVCAKFLLQFVLRLGATKESRG